MTALSPHSAAIVALLLTSIVVRVLPVLIRVRPAQQLQNLLQRVLPLAVFLNFAVYIGWTEIRNAPLAAGCAIAVVAFATFASRAGLILLTCAGTAAYVAGRIWL